MNSSSLFKFLGVAMIQKDLILAMKRTSWMVIQMVYLVIIGFVLALNIIWWKAESLDPESLWTTVSTSQMVFVYLFMQLMAICVLFPFLAGNSISRERSEKTWSLLRTTALSPGELIRGKFFALVSQGLYVLLLSAPLLVMTTLLGGVSLETLLAEFFLHVILIIWISAVGVLSSALARKGVGAFLATPLFFFFPMLMVLVFAGNCYLDQGQLISREIMLFYLAQPSEFFLSLSALLISIVGSLLGAIHLTSPLNSTRSIPTRIGILAFYVFVAGYCLYYQRMASSWAQDNPYDFMVFAFVSGAVLLPMLRIAGAGPDVPLSIRQFGRDRPIASRLMVLFTPGGIRNLFFCLLIILLFVPLGLSEWQPAGNNPNVDLVRAAQDYQFVQGLFFSVLLWVASVMAFAWFLGQCGCSSILSASMAFTLQLVAILVLTVLTLRQQVEAWPAFEPNISMISTPFNLFQLAGSSKARSIQRGFEAYFDSSIRMDTIFNLVSLLLFTGLGCWISVRKKAPLISVYSKVEKGLLLDLPGAPVPGSSDSIDSKDPVNADSVGQSKEAKEPSEESS